MKVVSFCYAKFFAMLSIISFIFFLISIVHPDYFKFRHMSLASLSVCYFSVAIFFILLDYIENEHWL